MEPCLDQEHSYSVDGEGAGGSLEDLVAGFVLLDHLQSSLSPFTDFFVNRGMENLKLWWL